MGRIIRPRRRERAQRERERERAREERRPERAREERRSLSFYTRGRRRQGGRKTGRVQRELNGLRRHTVPKKPRVSALPDDFVAVKRELEGKKIKIKRENDMLPRKYSHRDNTYDDLPLPRGGVDLSPRNRKRSRREDEVQNPATPPLVSPHNSCSESEVELEETQINSYGNGNEFIKIKKLNKNFPIKFLLKKLYK